MSMPFFRMEDLPPEQQAELKKQHELRHMQHEIAMHGVNSLFDTLDKEQLQVVRALIEGTTGDSDFGNHILGRLTELLRTKHGLCPCGAEHDADLPEGIKGVMFTTEGEPAPSPVQGAPTLTNMATGETFPLVDGEINVEVPIQDHSPAENAAAAAEEKQRALEVFHVMEIPASGGQVVCATEGCGERWPSLEARMDGKPGKGGCAQCAYREAWG